MGAFREIKNLFFFRKKKIFHADFLLFIIYFVLIHLAGGADHHGDVIGFPKKSIYLIREALHHQIWVYFDIQSKKA